MSIEKLMQILFPVVVISMVLAGIGWLSRWFVFLKPQKKKSMLIYRFLQILGVVVVSCIIVLFIL